MMLDKVDEVWNIVNRLPSDFFGLLLSKNFASIATWRNDFSPLLGMKKSVISRVPWYGWKRSTTYILAKTLSIDYSSVIFF